MEIPALTEIDDPLFDGYLEPTDPTETEIRGGQEVEATIGRPEWWFAEKLLGENFVPPQGDDTYVVIRLAYSMKPTKGQRAEEANFHMYLRSSGTGRQPVAFDLLPREQNEELPVELTFQLAPTLTFEEVEGAIGSVGAKIPIRFVKPIIRAYGLGESAVSWTFKHHRRHPLNGIREVYALVAYPTAAGKMRLNLELKVRVKDRYGPFWIGSKTPKGDILPGCYIPAE